MEKILLAATLISPLVMMFTKISKEVTGGKKRLPLFNLLFGIIIGGLWAMSFAPDDFILYLWAGVIAGGAAGGFYDLGASVVKTAKEDEDK